MNYAELSDTGRSLYKELGEWKYHFLLHKDRPVCHCPESHTRYCAWRKTLTAEETEIEKKLHIWGFYSYEREDMKGCNDSTGREVHIEDVVSLEDGTEGIVIHIITTEEVQVCPSGAGLPVIVHPKVLTVKHSFIERLKKLSTNEELLAILAGVEKRQLEARSSTKGTGSAPKVAKPLTVAIEEDV